jgi:hypothetical protein
MEFRTTLNIAASDYKISYQDPVMFIGSCFASEIGRQMEKGLMQVMINPSGVVFNPVSVANKIEMILKNRVFKVEDIYNFKGNYLSFYHYTDFSSDDPLRVIEKINKMNRDAHQFMSRTKFLFVTFGTAWVYRWKKSGEVVSNCHKIPSEFFDRQLLTVNEIVKLWQKTLKDLHAFNPDIKIIFTVSPVRHLKDGAHGNQISKSILFMAIEEMLQHPAVIGYFPSYELLMDDLRDYRFYGSDMVHPSEMAIEYIWESFSNCYFNKGTLDLWRDVHKVIKASGHQIRSESSSSVKEFAENMLSQILILQKKAPFINFSSQIEYFNLLAGKIK